MTCSFGTNGGDTSFDAVCEQTVPASVARIRLSAGVTSPHGHVYRADEITARWHCLRRMSALEKKRNIFTADVSDSLQGPQTTTNGRTVECRLELSVVSPASTESPFIDAPSHL